MNIQYSLALGKRRNPIGTIKQVCIWEASWPTGLEEPAWVEGRIKGDQSREHREVVFVTTLVWRDLKDYVDNVIDADF